MDEETNSLELNEQQKIRLLNLGLESDRPAASPDADEQKGDLLCDLLRCPFLVQLSEQDASSAVGEKLSPAGGAIMGPRLSELLLDPTTDLAVLRRVKEYAKSLGKDAGSDVQKDAFLTLYFAAIAAAVVLHEGRITEHSDQDLRYFFGFFAQVTWMPITLAGLFVRAAQFIRTRA
jgi:hypothetical protein